MVENATCSQRYYNNVKLKSEFCHHVLHKGTTGTHRPPFCDSCNFCHRPTCAQCSLFTDNDNIITEPFTAEDVEVAVHELSPRSTQSVERATMSPMINSLTNATVASVTASVEEDTEVPVPRRTTMSRSARLNLAATLRRICSSQQS